MSDLTSKVPLQLQTLIQQTQLMRNEICCKLRELIDQETTSYNSVEHLRLSAIDSVTIPSDTLHALSFTVIAGNVDVTFDSSTITYPTGYTANIPFSTTNAQTITIATDATGDVIIQYTY